MKKKVWGQLLSIDLLGCKHDSLTDKLKLAKFAPILCKEIKMVPHGKPHIQRFGVNDLEGYSMMQFIETSSITVHLDEFGDRAFVDIFSCKTFDEEKARKLSQSYFGAKKVKMRNYYRY